MCGYDRDAGTLSHVSTLNTAPYQNGTGLFASEVVVLSSVEARREDGASLVLVATRDATQALRDSIAVFTQAPTPGSADGHGGTDFEGGDYPVDHLRTTRIKTCSYPRTMAVLPQPPSSKVPTTTSVVVVACHNKNNAAVNNTAVFRLSRTAGALNLLDDFRLLAMPGFVSGFMI